MPELPEVETIVRELHSSAVGKKFWKVEGLLSSIFHPSLNKVTEQLPGLRILDVTRRGKFIVFILDKDMRLVIHLRMTGRLMWKKVNGREKFIRAIFYFSDATRLIFSDVRKFGRIWLYDKKNFEKATGISRLGVEPFGDNFTHEQIEKIFGQRKGILKNNLLRQDLIAGVGNIYADEICHRIGLHPSSRLEKLKRSDREKMYEAVKYCLTQGIKNCGVSLSDFVGTRGTLGKHQHYLKVYGREGDACYTCKEIIQKTVVAGRGTFFCKTCQVKV